MDEKESKILEDYVVKMLEVQKQQFEKPLSLDELKEIAYSVGMSESEWELSQQVMQGHLERGQGHLRNENWQDAVKELEQAVAINPFHEEGLYGLAKSHYELFKKDGKKEDQEAAEGYADRALKNEDNHYDSATIALLNSIRHAEEAHEKKRKNLYLRLGAVAGILVVIVLLTLYTASSTMRGKGETVDQQWAQVENVYQRRADLIPKVVNLVKAAAEYDQAKLDKLTEIQKNINAKDKAAFMKQQEQLGETLNEVLVDLQANSDIFRDLQVQIEGAENRISVERKKYNEAVSKYNNAANSFPMNLFGFKKREYFKSDAVNKNPEVKFD
jgi:LemA protein